MSTLEMLQRPTGTNGAAHTHGPRAAGKRVDAPVAAPARQSEATASAVELLFVSTEQRAHAILQSSSYGPVRHVLCEVRQRVLILRGRMPSFYLKQVAQTLLRELLSDGLVIDNQVEVDRTV